MSGRPILVIAGLEPSIVDKLRRAIADSADVRVIKTDDPVDELRKDLRKFAKTIEFAKAREEGPPSRGPKMRTRYPRRK